MASEMKIEKDSVILNINPKLYSLAVIYSAAYVFLDRAYILLDGDPEKEILVRLAPKKSEDLKKLGGDFLNELVNYEDYKRRAEETKEIRKMLLQRALITNNSPASQNDAEFDNLLEEINENEYIDDPEGIAVPWEEKYGEKANDNKNK